MIENPREHIIKLFEEHNAEYTLHEHAPVHTSEEAAEVRGESMAQGGKSLLLKAKDEFVLVVLPGDRKLSMKKLRNVLGVSNIRFAKPEEVKEMMGCEIGACYPVGNVIPVKTYVDSALATQPQLSFNVGTHTHTVTMSWNEFERVVQPEIIDVSEES